MNMSDLASAFLNSETTLQILIRCDTELLRLFNILYLQSSIDAFYKRIPNET